MMFKIMVPCFQRVPRSIPLSYTFSWTSLFHLLIFSVLITFDSATKWFFWVDPSPRRGASQVAQWLKKTKNKKKVCLPVQKTQETWVWSLGGKDPLEVEMVTHSNICAWEPPWTEEPGGLQSIGSQSLIRISNWTRRLLEGSPGWFVSQVLRI